ncbi:PAS domain-containing protein [Variovorax sp. PCZ-1]|uniref:PAS domain-containing protein n=1 Tax=Variovorax sp. PCZ-1 TaxID=2835533 RepID=UPI001BCD52C1|nr:PAS domain-containing protein [Variovorax sp. PCZ-1]MBS7807415.1 PAS domain-containing protein [Variovorax sp. PCZ-1]
MSQLRTSIRPVASFMSPVMIVLMVILLQVGLLGIFLYLAERDELQIEKAEIVLLLSYSAIAIVLAIVIGVIRYRWIQRENRVRQRLLDVIDAIPDPSAVRDVKGRYVMWNKAAESYHGIKAAHVLGKTPYELFPKAVARSILEIDAECSESNQTIVRRLVLPPLYGKGQRVANIRIAPVQSAADAGIRGVVTILHDVTQEEREAAALRQMSTQLKLALDTSGFGSWIWDLETNSVDYSEQCQALLRYKGKSFAQDLDFFTRIHPGDSESVVAATKRTLKEFAAYDQVYRLRCFDEVYRYFHASGECAIDDQGRRYFAGLLCPLDRSAN